MHLYFHMLIIHCAYFYWFIFSIEGKSNLNALLVGCFLSTSIFLFLPLGREGRPFGFSWKGKHDTWDVIFYFLLLSCTEMGSEIWCSIFLDKYTKWGLPCLVVLHYFQRIWDNLNTASLSKFPHLATRKETDVKCLPFLSQFKQDVTYRPASFNVVFRRLSLVVWDWIFSHVRMVFNRKTLGLWPSAFDTILGRKTKKNPALWVFLNR